MPREPKVRELAIVVRGVFNPLGFQPSWFERTKLLRPAETERAKLKIAHASIVDFSLEWGGLQVTTDRLVFTTQDEGMEGPALDLITGAFRASPATPVNALGINRNIHFVVESEAEWHAIGHKLVPKEGLWAGLLEAPGTLSVTVQGKQKEGRKGSFNIRVEPSAKFKHGIYIDANDHFEIRDKAGNNGTGEELCDIFKAVGKNSLQKTKTAIDTLMEKL